FFRIAQRYSASSTLILRVPFLGSAMCYSCHRLSHHQKRCDIRIHKRTLISHSFLSIKIYAGGKRTFLSAASRNGVSSNAVLEPLRNRESLRTRMSARRFACRHAAL